MTTTSNNQPVEVTRGTSVVLWLKEPVTRSPEFAILPKHQTVGKVIGTVVDITDSGKKTSTGESDLEILFEEVIAGVPIRFNINHSNIEFFSVNGSQ